MEEEEEEESGRGHEQVPAGHTDLQDEAAD